MKIERLIPPDGPPEEPLKTPKGYKLADPSVGKDRHHAHHAIFVNTLEEAAEHLARGYSLWMKQPKKRETLISASKLRVTP
jgi:hypothetical protein